MTWIHLWETSSRRSHQETGNPLDYYPNSYRVRTHRHLTGATTGVHSCWKDAIGYIGVLGDVHAGSGDVAATSESRAEWPVRTASHRRLRYHSLVSSCRQRQLRQIFAWMSEWYDNSAVETTKVRPISARRWICCTAVFQAIQCRCYWPSAWTDNKPRGKEPVSCHRVHLAEGRSNPLDGD